jgi:uncharacterized protein DUF6338
MLPAVPFAFLVLLALLPGWIFVRLAESKSERPGRSQLAELLELAAVGFSTIAISALIVAWLSIASHWFWLFNVEEWAHARHQYLGDHLGAALTSAALTIILSCLLAAGLFLAVYGRHPRDGNFSAGATVWVGTLGPAPNGMQNWIGIKRHDGSLIEGLLFACTAGTGDGPREVSLAAPIRLTPANAHPVDLPVDRVLVADSQIAAITVVHVPKPASVDKGLWATSPPGILAKVQGRLTRYLLPGGSSSRRRPPSG